MNQPDRAELKPRCAARKAALPGSGRSLKEARSTDPHGWADYNRLRKEFESLRVTSIKRKHAQVRSEYFSTVGARYIDSQRRGRDELQPIARPPSFEVPERATLANLLFPERCRDVNLEEIKEWTSHTDHCRLISSLAALCSRRCSPARKISKDLETTYIETEENEQSPDLYPVRCPSTVCLFCLGNSSLPAKDRERHLTKRANLKRHVIAEHIRHLEPGVSFCCPHPACSYHLHTVMELFNHAEVIHNVRH